MGVRTGEIQMIANGCEFAKWLTMESVGPDRRGPDSGPEGFVPVPIGEQHATG